MISRAASMPPASPQVPISTRSLSRAMLLSKSAPVTAFMALGVYVSVEAGRDQHNSFTLLDEVLGGLVAAFVIIDDDFGAFGIFFHPVEEDDGYAFFLQGAEMIQALRVKSHGEAIRPSTRL